MVSFIFGFITGVAVILIILLLSFVLRPWLRAVLSHAPVSLATIIGMRLRSNDPHLLIDAYLKIRIHRQQEPDKRPGYPRADGSGIRKKTKPK
jgi:uncharacterized protein YqfA (UPF0365 family)